jgi:hypothetical protein
VDAADDSGLDAGGGKAETGVPARETVLAEVLVERAEVPAADLVREKAKVRGKRLRSRERFRSGEGLRSGKEAKVRERFRSGKMQSPGRDEDREDAKSGKIVRETLQRKKITGAYRFVIYKKLVYNTIFMLNRQTN